MIEWMNENLPTIIGTAVVACIFIAIIVSRIKDRKNGKSGCSCGCEGCSVCDSCHEKK